MPTDETSPLRTEVTNAGVMLKEEIVASSSHLTEVVLFSVDYSFLDNLRIDVSICFFFFDKNHRIGLGVVAYTFNLIKKMGPLESVHSFLLKGSILFPIPQSIQLAFYSG